MRNVPVGSLQSLRRSEGICVPAKILYRFDKLSFEEAALIEPMTVSYYAALCTDPKPSDTILVVGPGPIGLQTERSR